MGSGNRQGGGHEERPPNERLDSWKEIAGYLKRDIRTVQRWEKREELPVHRHIHEKGGSVYAYPAELLGVAMDGPNEIRVHPDGRQIAFGAGKPPGKAELWVMENFLPRF